MNLKYRKILLESRTKNRVEIVYNKSACNLHPMFIAFRPSTLLLWLLLFERRMLWCFLRFDENCKMKLAKRFFHCFLFFCDKQYFLIKPRPTTTIASIMFVRIENANIHYKVQIVHCKHCTQDHSCTENKCTWYTRCEQYVGILYAMSNSIGFFLLHFKQLSNFLA